MKNQNDLEKFRVAFPLVKCHVENEFMTYRVRNGLAKSVAEEANKLIDEMGLALVAIASNLPYANSVCVQSSEIGYV